MGSVQGAMILTGMTNAEGIETLESVARETRMRNKTVAVCTSAACVPTRAEAGGFKKVNPKDGWCPRCGHAVFHMKAQYAGRKSRI